MSTLNDMKFKSIMAKRKNPYEGNEKFSDEMEAETANGGNFAKGGMVKCASCGGKMAMGGMSCAQGCKMAEGGAVDKKKNAVMAIIAKIGKKPMDSVGKSPDEMMGGEEGQMEGEMSASHEAKMAAADEVMSALKSGDTMAFAGALENFISCCGDMDD